MAPENQLYRTEHGGFDNGYRNEMDYRRIVNGKRIQPDYIVVFRTHGRIPNMDEAKKAREDFKRRGIDLPILIIDKDECLKAEAYELAGMILEYESSPNEKLKDQIRRKLETNQKTIENIRLYEGWDYSDDFQESIVEYFEERRNDKKHPDIQVERNQIEGLQDDSSVYLRNMIRIDDTQDEIVKKCFSKKDIEEFFTRMFDIVNSSNDVNKEENKDSIEDESKQ